ncbi:MAG TPA: cation-translocating P-type ATPase [Patescibacteria group bacterium]|nr:cation-translocating P-type ATPase [Patescibacteria group bacterium]
MTQAQGLTQKQAGELLTTYGPNEISHQSAQTPLNLALNQFNSPLVIILCLATILSLALGDTFEGLLILAIVILNAGLGFIQEYRAEKALLSLRQMTITIVRVTRDGKEREIDSKELVPGDVIFLEEGNKVPADAQLLHSLHFEVDESSLTGESIAIEKDAGEQANKLIFLGTTVVRGRATAVIKATGMKTKFGAIAAKLSTMQKEETQLEKKLKIVAKQIGFAALFVAVIIGIIGVIKGIPILTIILTAVSLAVAAVPEGLPAVITITLAVGTQRMAKKKAILRKLSAIEALGGITLIATDKTGTLTKNEMRVSRVWIDNKTFEVNALPKNNAPLRHLITTGILCNNASLAPQGASQKFDVIGDKTEGALLLLAQHLNIETQTRKQDGALTEEFAFDATSKTMSVIWKTGGSYRVHAKGAPEMILSQSSRILTADGDRALSEKEKKVIFQSFDEMAADGLRLIALATKTMSWQRQSRHQIESDLTFIGFVGISDPPREEVKDAIQTARNAGIETVMITGDNALTAHAIAKQIGLMHPRDEVITGSQFASLSKEEKRRKLPSIRVFARTSPEQKLEIVSLFQEAGHVVAATGDGVNDALALKQADVGVAMGITGTDVAKEAADMVITDDNYATIVSAVEEGRIIYDNMKASIKYLIGSNIGEILSILGGALLGWPFILLPIQILYINLITDGLPALALALNARHRNIMARAPRTEKNLFTTHDIRWLTEVSSLTALSTLAAFAVGYYLQNVALGRTLAFVILALAQQYIFLDIMAQDRSMFTKHVFTNIWVIIPLAVTALQLFLIHTSFFKAMFQLTKPHQIPLLIAVLLCSIMIVISEARKRFFRHWFYS